MWFDPRSRCSTLPLLPWQSTMAGKCGGSALSFLRSAFYENRYGRGKSPIYILLFQATQVAEALKPEGVTPFQDRSSTFHKAWLRNCNKVAKNKEEVIGSFRALCSSFPRSWPTTPHYEPSCSRQDIYSGLSLDLCSCSPQTHSHLSSFCQTKVSKHCF